MNLAWQHLAAAASATCLAAIAAWAWNDGDSRAHGGRTGSVAAIHGLVATMPDIGAFEDFNVNPANPFVPWQLRFSGGGGGGTPPPATEPGPDPGPPPALPPPLVLPDAPASPAGARLVGVLRHGDGMLAHLRLADGRVIALRPGAEAAGWTLLALADDGASAHLRDPHGHRLLARLGD
jgi:hypothetical protein